MNRIILYFFPFVVDIIVALTLFLGRHSLASRGYGEATIATLVMCFGIGYLLSSLLMMRIVKPHLAKALMLFSLAGMVVVGVCLANIQLLLAMQLLYLVFPFLVSLFFNAFQIYMLGVSNQDQRPLQVTIGHFTLAWSLGFALGPIISSQLVAKFDWSIAYYLISVLAGFVGTVLVFYSPRKSQLPVPPLLVEGDLAGAGNSTEPLEPGYGTSSTGFQGKRSLILPAWVGLMFGLTIWNVVMIYWPVQAVQWQVPINLRGLPEFTAAIAQGLTALGLTFATNWVFKPGWIAGLGAAGVAGLVYLSQQESAAFFFGGALLYGIFLGSMYSLAAFHAMVNEAKAVKRVALNETLIGACFLVAFPISGLFHSHGEVFQPAYWLLAVMLAVGLLTQFLLVMYISRRGTARKIENVRV